MILDDEEWTLLTAAPAAVYLLVAGSDGRVSAEERKTFVVGWKAALGSMSFSSEPSREVVFRAMLETSDDHLRQLRGLNPETLLGLLYQVNTLLDERLDEAEAGAVRQALLSLADEVASSTRGWFGLGRPVARAESEMVGRIRRAIS